MNGLGNAFKLHLITSLIIPTLPLAFVLSETKSTTPSMPLLSLPNYMVYESPALPLAWRCGKWGLALGVRKNFQVLCRLSVPPVLQGRVVALDVILASSSLAPKVLQLLGIYAHATRESLHSFWSEIRSLILQEPFPHLWMAAGDFNVTIAPRERSSGALSPEALIYQDFLMASDALDLKHEVDVNSDYMLRSYANGAKSVVDRAVISSSPIFSTSIQTQWDFLGATDHRAIHISAHILGSEGPSLVPFLPQRSLPPPHLLYPYLSSSTKAKFDDFAGRVDHEIADQGLLTHEIVSLDEFEFVYRALSKILLSAGDDVFGH
ncbi:uncharacterized protein EI90DRAFT_3131066 [Cantharellus anzutake]|uniref:uncharacterized protein n=1 Tax=Cantharellus anzutake TaxID=1750568 RepID=UPI0019044787|nr:uncharacterized protein EI90DRAFT_3131066 [Cantharellus anzutake]KAF8322351.1 hypothetical protein EI90DRAFT_3131066 [Cantharellus anzutake]